MASSSDELNPSVPVDMFASRATLPAEVDLDENQGVPFDSGVQGSQSDQRDIGLSVTAEKSSGDGYNWRKYGQKLVKGSEFPRSYYKCTYTNCEVKKIFERSGDGRITEIVYKGTHGHPKPLPSRRYTAGSILSIQEKNNEVLSVTAQEDKSAINGQISFNDDPKDTHKLSPHGKNGYRVIGAGTHLNGTNNEVDKDDPFPKRRKLDSVGTVVMPMIKQIREPRVVVQTASEVDILDDGYRWRKYGQKVVRGNPNPRSYYKCTIAGCPVRKHVERASYDPKAVITTYEGKHNHGIPTTATANGKSLIRSEESESISLDLGVGVICS